MNNNIAGNLSFALMTHLIIIIIILWWSNYSNVVVGCFFHLEKCSKSEECCSRNCTAGTCACLRFNETCEVVGRDHVPCCSGLCRPNGGCLGSRPINMHSSVSTCYEDSDCEELSTWINRACIDHHCTPCNSHGLPCKGKFDCCFGLGECSKNETCVQE